MSLPAPGELAPEWVKTLSDAPPCPCSQLGAMVLVVSSVRNTQVHEPKLDREIGEFGSKKLSRPCGEP